MSDLGKEERMDESGHVPVRGGGIELSYRIYGNPKGKVVFVVHGGPGLPLNEQEIHSLNPNNENLLILYNQRECGKTVDELQDVFSLNNPLLDASDDMQHVWKTVKPRLLEMGRTEEDIKPTVFGYSYGGMVASVWALHHPDQLSKLVLVAPYFNTPEDDARYYRTSISKVLKHEPASERATMEDEVNSRWRRRGRQARHVYAHATLINDRLNQMIETPQGDRHFELALMSFTRWPVDLAAKKKAQEFLQAFSEHAVLQVKSLTELMAERLKHVPIEIVGLGRDPYISPTGLQRIAEEITSLDHPNCRYKKAPHSGHWALRATQRHTVAKGLIQKALSKD